MPRHKIAKNVPISGWLSANQDSTEKRFIQVGNSLLLSKQFQELSDSAARLYLCMAMESGGNRKVVFTRSTAKKYGIAERTFIRNKQELIENGFIEVLNDDLSQFKATEIIFSFDWKK